MLIIIHLFLTCQKDTFPQGIKAGKGKCNCVYIYIFFKNSNLTLKQHGETFNPTLQRAVLVWFHSAASVRGGALYANNTQHDCGLKN